MAPYVATTDRRGDVDVLVREKFYVGIHESEALCGCLSAGLRDSVGLVLFFSSVSSVLGPTTLTTVSTLAPTNWLWHAYCARPCASQKIRCFHMDLSTDRASRPSDLVLVDGGGPSVWVYVSRVRPTSSYPFLSRRH